jgi:hypothetical protein
VIQQFQPKYDPSLNIESEPLKPINNTIQSDVISGVVNSVIQTPYTTVTKMTPITDNMNTDNEDKI